MSHLLAEWVNCEVKLSTTIKPESLDTLFRSGFLFGEILSTLDIHDPSTKKFINGAHVDALVRNWTTLEHVLSSKLGIKLSSNNAMDLIHGKYGAAAKLLYQIKSAVAGVPPTEKYAKKKVKALDSYPGTPLAGKAATVYEKQSFPKQAYMDKEHEFFETMIKAKLKRYEPVIDSSDKVVIPQLKLVMTPLKNPLDGTKKKVRQALDSGSRIIQHPATASPTFYEELERGRESVRLLDGNVKEFVTPPLPKSEIKIQKKRKQVQQMTIDEINNFEHRLHPGQPEDQEESDEKAYDSQLASHVIEEFVKTKSNMNPVQHIKQLARLVPPTEQKVETNRKFLEKIRNQKMEEEYSRKDREQRRRKIILGQQVTQQELEKKHVENLVLSKLLRQSKQERRIAEQLMQVRHEKEVMHENRVFRENQYQQRRQLDYEDALAKEYEQGEKARKEYREQLSLQLTQHKEILDAKKMTKHVKNSEDARALVYQILELSFKVGEYRVLNDMKEAPPRKVREWKSLLIKDQSISKPTNVSLESDPVMRDLAKDKSDSEAAEFAKQKEDEALSSIKVLDSREFSDYLQGSGLWSFAESTVTVPNINTMLGVIVNDILTLIAPEETPYEITPLPPVPLKMAILGKKFSGKGMLANMLSEKLNMTVLRVDSLIKDAIAHADISKKPEKEKKDASGKKPLSKAQIGAKLEIAMLEGQSPDDALLVSLFVEVLSQEAVRPGGWILVDFPNTRAQAVMLERELSGYEDPKPIKKGDLKRKEKTDKPGKTKSLIAPADGQSDSTVPSAVSALDCVFLLDIGNEVALSRAIGQRVDPITGKTYHLETSPPPPDEPGTFERLVPVEDEANSRTQLQYQLAAFDEEEEHIKEWLSRFKTLRLVDASDTTQKVAEQAMFAVRDIIAIKEKEKNAKDGVKPEGETSEATDAIKDEDKADKAKAANRNRSASIKPSEKRAMSPERPKNMPMSPSKDGKRVGTPAGPQSDGGETPLPSALNDILVEPIPNHIVRQVAADGRRLPSKEFAEILADQWATIEGSFTDSLKFIFRSLRRERDLILRYFFESKFNFKTFLERPDVKQELVDLFQAEFNSIEDDLRSDVDAKAELHQRVEDLRDKLWELSDKKREEGEQERLSIIEDRWVEDHSTILANLYISAMQGELDRHFASRQLVIDYYKDANGLPLLDQNRTPLKIPMCPTSGNSAPVEISHVLISAHEAQNVQRREGAQSASPANTQQAPAQTKGAKASATPARDGKDKKAAATGPKTVVPIPEASAPKHVDRQYNMIEKEHVAVDYENVNFPDIQAAVDFVMSSLTNAVLEHVPMESMAGEKKKKAAGAVEEKEEPEMVQPDFQKIVELEDSILRRRIERLRSCAVEHLKEFRNKGYEVYFQLDDWIGARFQAEMDATRDMVHMIKEAIEAETRLPNQLRLEGDKFQIDFGTLTLEPEPEPRPESPVEKFYPDQFTVLQMLNLSRQFRLLAPSGTISVKSFMDCLMKTSTLSQATDLLPENYASAELAQFQHICFILDPFETGFIGWRKFLLINAKVLPAPIESLLEIAHAYQNSPSFLANGKLSKEDFLKVPLWIEQDDPVDEGIKPANVFDRQKKMKEALYHIFSSVSVDAVALPSTANLLEESAEEESIAPDANAMVTTPQPIPIIIKEHDVIPDDGSVFDMIDFLMSCCLDESIQSGLGKAFHIMGDEEGKCNPTKVSSVLHHFLQIAESTHRLDRSESIDDPYPMDMILRVYEEAGVGSEGTLTADQFIATAEKLGIKYAACPLFQIEDLTVVGSRSRPSSGGQETKAL